ncbi:hypothetical protein NIES2135_05120 [Leptolyngbya boryana NIES-2135]|jgi:hypothetical protein|uniref:Trypsin-like peptidase domain-containing protein n=1 Tax=Leptolyngbya boryana NIES-2135 TaxID=1973484 RepID=A0A1Z4JAC2_LEPBY|nr:MULTISPECIES: trypsin-like peptidase domain-containing protein [Leptolyngbya]BAY53702.1 hypothetical protein NIES2135_05120 [Leptolyngbya boryana NIES-2135]MBD2367858.1 trypsin-like peptidase domain-containing protein [Leptolyngbya sp. FACHB-161]MBD2374294.1 trypsin-like peptidase domain-containing protein [Leptolyngbya sp. FACHB-238]MBD2398516.1 trypsin-like peptidase domain-containing protein [Leptolyngbya sp. FACHB-239]MBD2406218.1 trypsin-like peptidase domain-containing protein [Leptol
MRKVNVQNLLSYVPVHITLRFGETNLGVGTAFFYTHEGQDYLITNWHNVSGRDPQNYSLLSKEAGIPDNIVLRLPYLEALEDGTLVIKWLPSALNLYNDKDQTLPAWWEHPQHGSDVDVVAIRIRRPSETKSIPANNEVLDLEKLQFEPGMDVFVLGFPLGISGGGRFPIWKRGSIASEPDAHIDNLPKMYIDTATRQGMSGAPVYAQETGVWVPEGKTLHDFEHVAFGKGYRFLGIYSGRILGSDPLHAQLGIVWKEEAILDIIRSEKTGIPSNELTSKSTEAS